MANDLTTGKITPILIRFTIPLILGNVFQLTYNAMDSIIVGHFIGTEALAAVGICNPIISVLTLFLNGVSMGAGILIGNQFGAHDYNTLSRQISTTMISGVVFSLCVSAFGIIFATQILCLMQVDPSILSLTTEYIRIIFLGMVFTYLYNFFASTLRALGDSKTALYFLIASSIFNVFGDLFFIIVLGMGSRGCAISTVISEALSCIFCLFYIQISVPILQLGRKWMIFDTQLLKKTVSYAWASAMQQAVGPIGKLAIQAIVNTLGVPTAAAFSIVNRIDDFAYTPEQNIGHAMTSFMAQNNGAGEKARIKTGFRSGMMIEIVYGLAVLIIGFFFAKPLVNLFVRDQEVIAIGTRALRLLALFYLFPAITNCIQGFFRGIGKLRITLKCSIVNTSTRVIVSFFLVIAIHMGIEAVPISFLLGWIIMLIVEVPLLIRDYKSI